MYPPSQLARQADGKTELPIRGEVHTTFNRGNLTVKFSALVPDHLNNATSRHW